MHIYKRQRPNISIGTWIANTFYSEFLVTSHPPLTLMFICCSHKSIMLHISTQ